MLIKKEYNSKQAEKHFKRKEKVLGQFWTPYDIAKFIVHFCSKFTSRKDLLLDPACDKGVFLRAGIEEGFKNVVGIESVFNIPSSLY